MRSRPSHSVVIEEMTIVNFHESLLRENAGQCYAGGLSLGERLSLASLYQKLDICCRK